MIFSVQSCEIRRVIQHIFTQAFAVKFFCYIQAFDCGRKDDFEASAQNIFEKHKIKFEFALFNSDRSFHLLNAESRYNAMLSFELNGAKV